MSKQELLSLVERRQLGKPRNGSIFNFTDEQEWEILREYLVEKSLASNPYLTDESMIAYTPGETYKLLHHPDVVAWHGAVNNFVVPNEYGTIILVPCAKTKPWDEQHSRKSLFYKSYHEIIRLSQKGKIPPVYFATISEPLGIVPQEMWGNFLQYDNPGLFNEDYLRTGFMQADWDAVVGAKRALPFDPDMYGKSIEILGHVVASFLLNNYQNRRILSFVDSLSGHSSTHQDMLDHALAEIITQGIYPSIERYPKKRVPREAPLDFILSKIRNQ